MKLFDFFHKNDNTRNIPCSQDVIEAIMRRIFAIVLVVALLASFPVAHAITIYQSTASSITMPEDVRTGNYDGAYTGDVILGEPNGTGQVVFPYGTYSGAFLNGVPYGEGSYTFRSGECVSGRFSWVEAYRFRLEKPLNGSSPVYEGTEMRYTGMVKDNKLCGYGCIDFVNGGTFYGEFKDSSLVGPGTYVYMNNASSPISGSNWNLVNRIPSDMGGRWYSGLRQGTTWQGFGMLCYNHSYYVGEVRDVYCSGYGEYWQWSEAGDPSGTMWLKESGTYSQGGLISSGKPTPGNITVPTVPTPSVVPVVPSSGDKKCSTCNGWGDCKYCDGTGDCKTCGGNGEKPCPSRWCLFGSCSKCFNGYTIDGKVCSYCHGDGDCNTCFGRGSRSCSTCSGDGDCNFCYGSGDCQICGGDGYW